MSKQTDKMLFECQEMSGDNGIPDEDGDENSSEEKMLCQNEDHRLTAMD